MSFFPRAIAVTGSAIIVYHWAYLHSKAGSSQSPEGLYLRNVEGHCGADHILQTGLQASGISPGYC